MLNSMYDLFKEKFPNQIEAWDRYLEFIATDHNPLVLSQLDHKFEWLLEDSALAAKVCDVYKPKLLKTNRNDYLGDIYINSCLPPDEAQDKRNYLMPRHEALRMASQLIGETEELIAVFDAKVGSGRFLLAGQGLAPNAHFFGIDNDIRMVRIAYTNMLIHNVTGFILHADSSLHETDISKENGQYNWKFCNKWNSHIDKLQPRVKKAQGNLFENGS